MKENLTKKDLENIKNICYGNHNDSFPEYDMANKIINNLGAGRNPDECCIEEVTLFADLAIDCGRTEDYDEHFAGLHEFVDMFYEEVVEFIFKTIEEYK
jgi:hypothetical protein